MTIDSSDPLAADRADRSPVKRTSLIPRGARVLFVDDEPLLQRAAFHLLRQAGATPVVAGTHGEAVNVASGELELAVGILDFRMPDGPVGELVERLQEARPRLPLIGTSASACRSDFARHGVTRFLAKPWGSRELSRAVELAIHADRT